jgi:hypothetical protein
MLTGKGPLGRSGVEPASIMAERMRRASTLPVAATPDPGTVDPSSQAAEAPGGKPGPRRKRRAWPPLRKRLKREIG